MSAYCRLRSASKWGAMPASVLISALVVWQSSYAAFSTTTVNPSNTFGSGSVVLSDDDSGTAMFTPTLLKPADTGTKCIVVTSTGTLASAVELYATGYSTTNGLSTYLDMVIDEGTGGTFASSGPTSCTGFVAGATSSPARWPRSAPPRPALPPVSAPGHRRGPVRRPGPTGSKYTLNAATPNTAQSGTAALGFTWEAQNI